MKLAYWGSGPISRFHLPAAREAGFEIEVCFSRSGSENLEAFGENWSVPVARSEDEFLTIARGCDAIAIALQTEATPGALAAVANMGLPVLCEKPGAMSVRDLDDSVRAFRRIEKLYFAYNRRHYASVNWLKEFVHESDGGVAMATWPDSVAGTHQWKVNGCHLIDTLQYIFGGLSVCSVTPTLGSSMALVTLSSHQGVPISLAWVPGSASNPRISFFGRPGFAEISPLESLRFFDDLEVHQPTLNFPLRRYLPRKAHEVEEKVSEHKPGFGAQWNCFFATVAGRSGGSALATFLEARRALEITEFLSSSWESH